MKRLKIKNGYTRMKMMSKYYVSYRVPTLISETKFAGPYNMEEALSHAEDVANFEYVEECQIISEEKFIKQNSEKN